MLRNAPEFIRSLPLTNDEIEEVKVNVVQLSANKENMSKSSSPIKKVLTRYGIRRVKSTTKALYAVQPIEIIKAPSTKIKTIKKARL